MTKCTFLLSVRCGDWNVSAGWTHADSLPHPLCQNVSGTCRLNVCLGTGDVLHPFTLSSCFLKQHTADSSLEKPESWFNDNFCMLPNSQLAADWLLAPQSALLTLAALPLTLDGSCLWQNQATVMLQLQMLLVQRKTQTCKKEAEGKHWIWGRTTHSLSRNQDEMKTHSYSGGGAAATWSKVTSCREQSLRIFITRYVEFKSSA